MIDLIYIASPSFSGSTLLTFLLNTHPSIATIGELKWGDIDFDDYRCSCDRLLRECPFWLSVVAQMSERSLTFDLQRPPTDFRCRGRTMADRIVRARVRGPLFERVRDTMVAVMPPARRSWPTIARFNREIIEVILELQSGSVFVDGSKDPVRLKYLHETGNYRIRVIQLVRDGRGVVNSAIKNERHSVEHAAREWKCTHRQIECVADRIRPDALIRVRYEDLCADPRAEMGRLFQTLALPDAPWIEKFRDVEHHILGNRMRLRQETTIALDEKWRTTLDEKALATFDAVAGPLNRRYGYD